MTYLPRQRLVFLDGRGQRREGYYAHDGFRGELIFVSAQPGGQAGWWVERVDVVEVGEQAAKKRERK